MPVSKGGKTVLQNTGYFSSSTFYAGDEMTKRMKRPLQGAVRKKIERFSRKGRIVRGLARLEAPWKALNCFSSEVVTMREGENPDKKRGEWIAKIVVKPGIWAVTVWDFSVE